MSSSPTRRDAALGAAGLATVAAAFEVLPRVGVLPAEYVPTFGKVAVRLAEMVTEGPFWSAVGETVLAWAIGLAVATLVGAVVGLLLGSWPWLHRVSASTMELLRPVPPVALIPLLTFTVGKGLGGSLVLVIYSCVWIVLFQVIYGVRNVDPVARETASVYGLGRLAQVRHLTWATALPYTVTGVRLAASVALALTVTAGLVMGSPGLGREIWAAQSGGDVATMYALIVVTGLIGVVINTAFGAVERRLLHWHSSTRSVVA